MYGAQLTAILHPHREGATLLIRSHDLDRFVALEGTSRPAHLILALATTGTEYQKADAADKHHAAVAKLAHGASSAGTINRGQAVRKGCSLVLRACCDRGREVSTNGRAKKQAPQSGASRNARNRGSCSASFRTDARQRPGAKSVTVM